jgi:hypothetical protein
MLKINFKKSKTQNWLINLHWTGLGLGRRLQEKTLKSYNEKEALNILKASLGGSDPIHSQNRQTRKSNQAGWRVGNDFSARVVGQKERFV